ncbi:trimeric-like protein [Plasmopara halstedii]|uniref:Dynactin subunit 6 n=1 Tax=Plasmopara halstedii TaxID=4781 RepID=A0A0P1AH05_PLAHL|nr:trimeric-like protein [Plasmopara halstedii]CEG39893.1 trimeric-like protein [Plasmopara halstedii]|eukprot:XP_024576262.1 trimeric-like protein [Plasmopara halstedii]
MVFHITGMQVASTAAVCVNAEVQGAVTIGAQCAVHPGACLRSTTGSIVLGERCFVEDGAILVNDTAEVMKIGFDNLFESGCIVQSHSIGNGNLFEPKARTLAGSVIGDNCVIGSGVVVTAGEHVPDNSILVAVQIPQGGTRRILAIPVRWNAYLMSVATWDFATCWF